MIKSIKRFFSKKFISWEEYSAKLCFMDSHYFQQKTRRESIENSRGVGK